MTTHIPKILLNSLKVAAAGASICAVAWCFVTFSSPAGEVEQAEANIYDMGFFSPPTKQESFVRILKDYDMEKPRSYNWNGNSVYFSMGSVDESPQQVLRDFQDQLVAKGLNKKAHYSVSPAIAPAGMSRLQSTPDRATQRQMLARSGQKLDKLDDFFGGGLVPITIGKNHIAMAGATSKDKAPDALQFVKEHIARKTRLPETVGQMRYFEAFRAPGDKKTTITAIWSDDKLELEKFSPDAKRSDLAVSTEVPACLGCRRIMNFRGEGAERDYGTNVFVGRQNAAETLEFYNRAMQARGWKLAGSTQALRLLQARGVVPPLSAEMASYSKDGKFATVMAYPMGRSGETQVHVFDSP